MTVLVDSDILIDVTRARDADILERWTELSKSQTAILCSPVSIAELWHGALPREHALLNELFLSLKAVNIDAETGRKAGEIMHLYSKSHGVELADALIAASALENQALLWTKNRKHYPMKALIFFPSPGGRAS